MILHQHGQFRVEEAQCAGQGLDHRHVHSGGHERFAALHADQASADDDGFFAFAGIGRPEKFFLKLEEEGYRLAARRSFPDHHAFTFAEMTALLDEADSLDAVPVTTEKDQVRLPRGIVGSNWSRDRVAVFGVHARFAEEQAVVALLVDIRRRWMARHFSSKQQD